MDAAFAQAVLAGQAEAVASTGLVDGDLALLRVVDPAALSADPGGKRRAQVLGNAASEFTLSLTAAAHRISDLLDAFPSAPEFHAAIAEDGRLPLAFAAYGIRRAAERDQRELLAVLELEAAMARLRRSSPSPHPPGEDRSSGAAVAVVGALVLAPTTR